MSGDLLLKMPNVYEPKRKNRFIFRFPSDLGIQEWTVESGKRPAINQTATEIQFLNTSTWVLGRYTWQEMQVVFRDVIGPSSSQAIMEWVRLGTETLSGRQGYAAGYKRDVELEMLDPTGAVVQDKFLRNFVLCPWHGGLRSDFRFSHHRPAHGDSMVLRMLACSGSRYPFAGAHGLRIEIRRCHTDGDTRSSGASHRSIDRHSCL